MTHHRLLALALLASLAGCGGSNDAEATEENSTQPVEATAGAEGAMDDAQISPIPYQPNPVLNVYVQGPDPAHGELAAGTPDDFTASIVVTNTGDDPVEVEFAYIEFEMRTPNAEPIDCEDPGNEPVQGPPTLGPGEAHTYRSSFHCVPPEPGEYDVWVFLSFGARLDADTDRERFTAGHYTIHVR